MDAWVVINNWTSVFFELGCFHRVQYKFNPAVEHLLLIPVHGRWWLIAAAGQVVGALGLWRMSGPGCWEDMADWTRTDRQADRRAEGQRLKQLEERRESDVLSDPVWWFQEDKTGEPMALQVEPLTRALPYTGTASHSFCKASLILSWLCQWGLALCLAPKSAWQTSLLSPCC